MGMTATVKMLVKVSYCLEGDGDAETVLPTPRGLETGDIQVFS
jgi:hypothetical protein